jgi:hypothetical protein
MPAPEIDDGKWCTTDSCDPVTGEVENLADKCPKDENYCDLELCDEDNDKCIKSDIPDLDDGDWCTKDICDPATGAITIPRPPQCPDDGILCNGTEECSGWADPPFCFHKALELPPASDGCHKSVCDEAQGIIDVPDCETDENLCDTEICNDETCVVSTPRVTAVSWVDEFPCEGPEFDALVADLQEKGCQDFPCDAAAPDFTGQGNYWEETAQTLVKWLCLTATSEPPADPPSAAALQTLSSEKQFRAMSMHNPIHLLCYDGVILEENGCQTFQNHGYTKNIAFTKWLTEKPGGPQALLGTHKCTKSGGVGTQCVDVDYLHRFRVDSVPVDTVHGKYHGLDGAADQDTSGSPWAFHRTTYKVCCPDAGAAPGAQGEYDLEVTTSKYPSTRVYLQTPLTASVETHEQSDLGSFYFSNINGAGEQLPAPVTVLSKTINQTTPFDFDLPVCTPFEPDNPQCIHAPINIDDEDPCTEDVCDPDTGDVDNNPTCCEAPDQPENTNFVLPRVKVAYDVPGSGTWCKALALPGELKVSGALGTKISNTFDPSCKWQANFWGFQKGSFSACGFGAELTGELAGQGTFSFCKDCSTPPKWECGEMSCVEATLTATGQVAAVVEGVYELLDPNVGIGLGCNLAGKMGMEYVLEAYYRRPMNTSCADGKCGPRCMLTTVKAGPVGEVSGGCKAALAGVTLSGNIKAGIKGKIGGRIKVLSAALDAAEQLVNLPPLDSENDGCGGGAFCMLGTLTPYIGASGGLGGAAAGLSGDVEFFTHDCWRTWSLDNCEGGTPLQQPWQCETHFIDIWPPNWWPPWGD